MTPDDLPAPHRYPYSADFAEGISKTMPLHLRMRACRHGYMMYFAHDQHIGASLEWYGEWAEVEQDLFRCVVNPGMTVIEAGANIGTHTLTLARLAGPAGRVHAFEPQRRIFQMLCANLALNDIGNVFAHPVGVGAANGMMSLPPIDYTKFGNFAGVELSTEEGEPVEVRSIDSYGFDKVGFMKIDVESMEVDVLRGSLETITRCRPVIFFENDRLDGVGEAMMMLFGQGYRCWWHLSTPFNPANYFGQEQDIWKGVAASNNMICLPREICTPALLEAISHLPEALEPSETWQHAATRTSRLLAIPSRE
jgi:FkbM family methyltransferase